MLAAVYPLGLRQILRGETKELTRFTDHRTGPKFQHHGEQRDVRGVEDLGTVRQVQRPELRRRVQDIYPATSATGHLGAEGAADEIYRVPQDAVPGLGLCPTLHAHCHHCTMAQGQDGCVTVFDQLLISHEAHGAAVWPVRGTWEEVWGSVSIEGLQEAGCAW